MVDTVALAFVRYEHTRTISVPGHANARVEGVVIHSRQQSKVCLQTYFLDGGEGWRRHLNTTPGNFHSLGSCILPGIKKRKKKEKKRKNNVNFIPENVISIY